MLRSMHGKTITKLRKASAERRCNSCSKIKERSKNNSIIFSMYGKKSMDTPVRNIDEIGGNEWVKKKMT
jgi:hypothetical protein